MQESTFDDLPEWMKQDKNIRQKVTDISSQNKIRRSEVPISLLDLKLYKKIERTKLEKGNDTFIDLLLLCYAINYTSISSRPIPDFAIYEYFNNRNKLNDIYNTLRSRRKTVNREVREYYDGAKKILDNFINVDYFEIDNSDIILSLDRIRGESDPSDIISLKKSCKLSVTVESNFLKIESKYFRVTCNFELDEIFDFFECIRKNQDVTFHNLSFKNQVLSVIQDFSLIRINVTEFNKFVFFRVEL